MEFQRVVLENSAFRTEGERIYHESGNICLTRIYVNRDVMISYRWRQR